MGAPRSELEALLTDAAMAELSDNIERAVAGYEAAIRAGPLEARAYMGKCSLLRRLGRKEEAQACAAAFARALPADALAQHELGLSLLHLKRYPEAVKAFEKALSIQPSLSAAWANMGIALSRLGETDAAFRCYDRAAGKAPLLSVPTVPPSNGKRDFDEALQASMSGLLETGGGFLQILAEPPFSFKVSAALLVALLRDYDMDGVVVSMAKPSAMYRQVLEKRVVTRHPPYYVDVSASPAAAQAASPASQEISAFELDRIDAAVRTGLQKAAEMYGGEQHFVLLDDLASVEFYNGPVVVQRFLGNFFSDLSMLNIFCFVIMPEGRAIGLPGASFFSRQEKLHVRSEWFAV
jgi:tetratricopeptide (TPR) repeat protein